MDKVSYALGLGIGRQLTDMGAKDLNIDDFAQAIKDVLAGGEVKLSDTEAQTIVHAESRGDGVGGLVTYDTWTRDL